MKTNRSSFCRLPLPPGRVRSDNVQFTFSPTARLISGGEALVEVTIPAGADPAAMRVRVGQRDVTSALQCARRALSGLIEGLGWRERRHAQLPGGARTSALPTSQRRAVFSGPQVQPWSCNPGATDALCNSGPSYQYFYVPAGVDPQATRDSSVAWRPGYVFCALQPAVLHPLR